MTPEELVIFALGIIAGAIATVIGSVILQALMEVERLVKQLERVRRIEPDSDWVED